MIEIKFKLDDGVRIPQFKTVGASCLDCYSSEDKWVWLKPILVDLGFAVELPEGYEMVIRPRSGMTLKGHYAQVGTIDSDYRGKCKACIWSLLPYHIKKGDRVCQCHISKNDEITTAITDVLSDTERGSSGFGSTGK